MFVLGQNPRKECECAKLHKIIPGLALALCTGRGDLRVLTPPLISRDPTCCEPNRLQLRTRLDESTVGSSAYTSTALGAVSNNATMRKKSKTMVKRLGRRNSPQFVKEAGDLNFPACFRLPLLFVLQACLTLPLRILHPPYSMLHTPYPGRMKKAAQEKPLGAQTLRHLLPCTHTVPSWRSLGICTIRSVQARRGNTTVVPIGRMQLRLASELFAVR